jgi:serine/threonine-protein kinase
MHVNLKVLAGPYAGQVFTFDRHATFLIGRSEAAHLCLPNDRFFSRNHCMLEISPPYCYVRDLGSTNGTFVNGKSVQEAFLRTGDRIQGGQTVLAVEVVAGDSFAGAGKQQLAATQPSIVSTNCLRCNRVEYASATSPDERLTFICDDCRVALRQEPQPIPGYEIVKVLGRGGMGCVALARSQRTGKAVAIKTLLPEVAVSDQALKRFMREIEVASALDHPNVVKYLAHGTSDGVIFLVTEFVEGADAAKLADSRGGKLPYREALDLIIQALDALSFAHSKGFIHRDIKEHNILVSGSWPRCTAKLTDFGLAKSFKQSGMSGITMAGDMAGTFAYMPPEQIRDFQYSQPSSDIYSIGMTAYSLVTGNFALDIPPNATAADVIKAIFEKPNQPVALYEREVPQPIAWIIERAISKEPSDRWHSAEAMRRALSHALQC